MVYKLFRDIPFVRLIPVWITLLCVSQVVTGQSQSLYFELDWHLVEQKSTDDGEIGKTVLSFSGAHYTDSLPAIPFFQKRIRNDIPHFRYEMHIVDPQFINVSHEEIKAIEASGVQFADLALHHSDQWERKQHYTVLRLYPLRYNSELGTYEKLISFGLLKEPVYDAALRYESTHTYASSSVLADGTWYKVCVDQTGVYRLTYDDLSALGISMQGLQKQHIGVYGNGGGMLPESNQAFRHDDLQENSIFISGAEQGLFQQGDYILFYGQSPNQWHYNRQTGFFEHEVHLYATETCYFITPDRGTGKRIDSRASVSEAATHQVVSFQDYTYHQRDLTNLIGSGRDWYGEVFDATLTRSFDFSFPGLDRQTPARVKVAVAARSPVLSYFRLRTGGEDTSFGVPLVNLTDQNNFFARNATSSMLFLPDEADRVRVTLTYDRPTSTARGWLNYIAINVTRALRFSGSQLLFRNSTVVGPGHIAAYTLSNANNQVTVWDVTDPLQVKRQQASLQGSQLSFRVQQEVIREFVAFDGTTFLRPRLAGKVENQNLHAMQPSDMIIVAPDMFLEEAGRLASFRSANDGLSVAIVTPRQIYNEFSSGVPDASAIRNFMKMFYDRAETPRQFPRYLLLFGNGTYDNKDMLGYGGNFIPTFQSVASLSPANSYMTDDYFGILDDLEGEEAFGLLDMGIGRLPVRTVMEARMLVDKIIRYDKRIEAFDPNATTPRQDNAISNYADWRNMVVFIADDGDFNTHLIHAERLTNIVADNHPYYNLDKIYLDAYQMTTLAGGARYPDVNRAINERMNQGALLINYIGHGGVRGLAHERVVTFDDIATWNNYYNMPVFMTATCEFSSFDQPDPEELSAGVRILLKPDGGAVALYTTTRLAWSGTNLTLNENFMRLVFQTDSNGEHHRLGDLIRLAKVQSDGMVQPWRLKNFVLLGDPSMRMAYPEYRVVTRELPDTIRALQPVTVSGYITDRQGNKINNYNGLIYPTVFDKYSNLQTLANANDSNKANFRMRNSMLYKGKASVVDGEFSFEFIVPKDISYFFDHGKISYYFDNGETDGHGFYDGFIVGGSLDKATADTEGPIIRLFMNDTTFVSGGTTNENPVLIAHLIDESGINITGRIGHDIVAWLNNQHTQPIVLNNFYEADRDTYRSGRVVYPFSRLEDGLYTLSLRVWDTFNNPSTESIEFVVARSTEMVLGKLLNYPNPVRSEGTNFVFTHNQQNVDLEVRIDIFDLQGRLLKSLEQRVRSGGHRSPPLHWDGRADGGAQLGNGVYIFRLSLKGADGRQAVQSEKLVIMRE